MYSVLLTMINQEKWKISLPSTGRNSQCLKLGRRSHCRRHGDTETSLLSEDQVEAIEKLSFAEATPDAKSTVVAVDALILILKGETNKNTIRQTLLLLEKIFNYDQKYSASILSVSNLSSLCTILNEKMHELDSLQTPVSSVPSDRTESTRRLIVLLSGFLCSVSLSEESAEPAEPVESVESPEASNPQATLRSTFLSFVLSSFSAVSQKSMDEMDSLLVISGLAVCSAWRGCLLDVSALQAEPSGRGAVESASDVGPGGRLNVV